MSKWDRPCGSFVANVEDHPCLTCGWARKFHLNRAPQKMVQIEDEPAGPVPGTGTTYGLHQELGEPGLEFEVKVSGQGVVSNPKTVEQEEEEEGVKPIKRKRGRPRKKEW